jgi:hypothetical protein
MTGRDLQSIDVQVTNPAGAPVKVPLPHLECNKTMNRNCIYYAAGSAGYFDLDMASLPAGEYQVRLVGHIPRTSETTALNIAVYHHP